MGPSNLRRVKGRLHMRQDVENLPPIYSTYRFTKLQVLLVSDLLLKAGREIH